MRLFFDTNVLVSALTTRGLCAELFAAGLLSHDLATCHAVLHELERILADKFRLPAPVVAGYLALLQERAELVESQTTLPESPDPDDAPILACALAGRADLFVTGDKALLDMNTLEAMPIVSPRECWERLRNFSRPRGHKGVPILPG